MICSRRDCPLPTSRNEGDEEIASSECDGDVVDLGSGDSSEAVGEEVAICSSCQACEGYTCLHK